MADMQSDENKQSFETAMGRLEKIVEAMDDRGMHLDDLIVNYEEGTKLVKVCEESPLHRAGGTWLHPARGS